MKIGILTQPLHTNYGGLLQAYALQRVLNDMEHDVTTIDIRPSLKSEPINKRVRRIFKLFYKKYLLNQKEIQSVFYPSFTEYRYKVISSSTQTFIDNHIKISEEINSRQAATSLDSSEFNAFVVGSDQVWRPQYAPIDIRLFFLDFLKKSNPLRISYAASFGVDECEFDSKTLQECSKALKEFNAISVREKSGQNLCEAHFGCKAEHVLDPTLLLDRQDYLKLLPNVSESSPTIMAYVLDKNTETTAIINSISQTLNLSTNEVMPSELYYDFKWKDLSECKYPPVEDWIAGFHSAEYVITDSFHGTLFSIIFNKPFIVIANKSRGVSRFNSILELFDLQDRLFTGHDNLNHQLTQNIDWEKVNEKKQILQKESIMFLKSALEG